MGVRRRLAAIVFVDLVDSSRRISIDEESGLRRWRVVDRLVRASVSEHGGRVVKSLGDGLMLEFESVVQAVRCARDVQRRMTANGEGLPPQDVVYVRIGIHVGDVVEEEGDLYGSAVNIAARLEKAAAPGGICITREVYSQVRSAEPLTYVPVPPERLTNLPEPVEVFEIQPALTIEPVRPVPFSPAPVAPTPVSDTGWLGLTSGVALLVAAAVAACLGIVYFKSVNVVFALGGWLFASEAAKSGVRLIQRTLQEPSGEGAEAGAASPVDGARAWKQFVGGLVLIIAGAIAAGLGVWLLKEQTAFSTASWVFGGVTAIKGVHLVRGAPFGEIEVEVEDEEDAEKTEARELDQEARSGRLTLKHAIRRGKEPHLALRDAGICAAILTALAVALAFGGTAVPGTGFWPSVFRIGMWGVGGVGGVGAAWMLIDSLRSKFRLAPLDPDIVDACGAVADAPEEVSRALDRGIASFGRLHQILSEPVWKSAGIPAKAHLKEGRRQLMAMLARGQQLQRVAATLESLSERRSSAAEYQAMRDRYALQAERLEAAADLFEQAEAEIARAYLAVTTQGTRSQQPDAAALRELPASFSAVAELLESLDPMPAVSVRPVSPAVAEQVVQVGRGTASGNE